MGQQFRANPPVVRVPALALDRGNARTARDGAAGAGRLAVDGRLRHAHIIPESPQSTRTVFGVLQNSSVQALRVRSTRARVFGRTVLQTHKKGGEISPPNIWPSRKNAG
jgi:hypothetical protein